MPCGGRKTSSVHHHSKEYIFSGPLGSLGSFRVSLQFRNRIPLKPVLRGVGSVAPSRYCTLTDSVKPNLLFFFFDVVLASRGSSYRT